MNTLQTWHEAVFPGAVGLELGVRPFLGHLSGTPPLSFIPFSHPPPASVAPSAGSTLEGRACNKNILFSSMKTTPLQATKKFSSILVLSSKEL